jgi:hypothetical protein
VCFRNVVFVYSVTIEDVQMHISDTSHAVEGLPGLSVWDD